MNTIFFAVSVCSNSCVGHLPRIEISFFLLSICGDEFISTPKTITCLTTPLPTEKIPFLIIPIPYREYLYLLISTFLVRRPAPNQQFSVVG